MPDQRNKEVNYPTSCEGCPNNPNSYESLSSLKSDIKLQQAWFDYLAKQGLSDDYIKSMGGNDEDNTL